MALAETNFTYFFTFPNLMPLISFSYLISQASIMLNKSGKNRCLCFAPDIKGKGFSISPLSMVFTLCLSYMAFIMLTFLPSITQLLRVFIMKRCWILVNIFLYLLRWLYDFHPSFLRMVYHIDWFVHLKPILHLWNKSHLIVMYNFFNALLNLDCYYVVEDFCICIRDTGLYFFPRSLLFGFGIVVMLVFIKCVWMFSFSYFLENFWEWFLLIPL